MITETQLQGLKEMFSPTEKTEYFFQGCKIEVERAGDYYDYEIFTQDPIYGKWHTWHYEYDAEFTSEEEAKKHAESWIDNWEPNDDYYAQ